ncbi:MAG: LacI family DNA-binding transcriptional regulator [Actinomycetota bacterium]|nr:LacI family DNA-binding transcriptional regulator [Actinomycetota bacterium]
MAKSSRATLIDVARRAGVAKTTASDALSGSGRVAASTRQAVLAAAEQLGYVPNHAARHLRRASTGAIGLHVPERIHRSSYYMSFVFGALDVAATRDHDVTMFTGSGSDYRSRLPRVDGVVLSDPVRDDPLIDHLREVGLPAVTCERVAGGTPADGTVWSRHDEGVRDLLDELAASGANRPGMIVPADEWDWSASLTRGYTSWCEDHDTPVRIERIPFESPADDVRAAARRLLERDPAIDAVVCGPDGTAAQVLPELRALERRVGEDVLLASCVDGPLMQVADPPITAIDLRPRDAGSRCADLLFSLISGEAEPGTEIIHPTELVVRASSRGLGRTP